MRTALPIPLPSEAGHPELSLHLPKAGRRRDKQPWRRALHKTGVPKRGCQQHTEGGLLSNTHDGLKNTFPRPTDTAGGALSTSKQRDAGTQQTVPTDTQTAQARRWRRRRSLLRTYKLPSPLACAGPLPPRQSSCEQSRRRWRQRQHDGAEVDGARTRGCARAPAPRLACMHPPPP
jgi:hypothetical protein